MSWSVISRSTTYSSWNRGSAGSSENRSTSRPVRERCCCESRVKLQACRVGQGWYSPADGAAGSAPAPPFIPEDASDRGAIHECAGLEFAKQFIERSARFLLDVAPQAADLFVDVVPIQERHSTYFLSCLGHFARSEPQGAPPRSISACRLSCPDTCRTIWLRSGLARPGGGHRCHGVPRHSPEQLEHQLGRCHYDP